MDDASASSDAAEANHTRHLCGWIMAQVDLAGAVPARRCQRAISTVAVNSFVSRQPVFGDIAVFYSRRQFDALDHGT